MTIDVLDLIAEKGGNPEAARESQRKRGESVELVDEVIALYAAWVKSGCATLALGFALAATDAFGLCRRLRAQSNKQKGERDTEGYYS